MQYHPTADAALTDKTPGARALRCTLAEAFKLAGKSTIDVEGRPAWYCTPISYGPGQSKTGIEIWNVGVSLNHEANDSSIQAFEAAQSAWLAV